MLLELEPAIDPRINARAIATASAIRRNAPAGIRDVRPTYRSVAVDFDPLAVDADRVRALLEAACAETPLLEETDPIEVMVAYGGEDGPDLAEVARFARLSADEVVDRHAATVYRVFMLGFLPGFPYLGSVDPRIAAPRRATPRVRIPAGSVGIAGRQTGIYPFESPGGWQIIGRTPLSLFDVDRPQPALCMPGDRVKFLPVRDPRVFDAATRPRPLASGRPGIRDPAALTVLEPGLFTTVQDAGRWGQQHLGVPVSGAMDARSHRQANALVGNGADAATLEVTLAGPALRMERAVTLAVAGADLGATIDGIAMPPGRAFALRTGSVLRFGGRRWGGRAYVALGGGIDVPLVLGSRATHTRSGIGGFYGRPLRAGDGLTLGAPGGDLFTSRPRARATVAGGARLRVLPGPQDDVFPAAAFDLLQSMRFHVTPQSDRMGYRLTGPGTLPAPRDAEMISDATFAGAVQIPPSGEPILLMSDRQTTGGYPQIGVVITADLPIAGQLVPGDWVEFAMCTHAEAIAALASEEEGLRRLG
jgi:KipI family sensor histidine kinase inhibitor